MRLMVMTASPACQFQRAGDFRRRAGTACIRGWSITFRMTRLALVGRQAQKAELGARLGVGGDESALALAAHQQVLGRQFVDRLAHRALAHLVAGAASSISLGIMSPGFHSPASRPWVIRPLICWYSGLNVGEPAASGAAYLADGAMFWNCAAGVRNSWALAGNLLCNGGGRKLGDGGFRAHAPSY